MESEKSDFLKEFNIVNLSPDLVNSDLMDLESEIDSFADDFSIPEVIEENTDFGDEQTLRQKIQAMPSLNSKQNKILFESLKNGIEIEAIKNNPEFLKNKKLLPLINESSDIKSLIINGNLRIVSQYAGRYSNRGLDYEDLFQEGVTGLIRASEKFDVELGFTFSTYAQNWVKQRITRSIIDKGNSIRLPVPLYHALSKAYQIIEEFEKNNQRTPKWGELVSNLISNYHFSKDKAEKLTEVIYGKKYNPLSFNLKTRYEELEIGDLIPDDFNLENETLDQVQSDNLKTDVLNVIHELNEREKMVITEYFGIGGKKSTLFELSKKLGMTHSGAAQLKERTLLKIRSICHSKSLLSHYFSTEDEDFVISENVKDDNVVFENDKKYKYFEKAKRKTIANVWKKSNLNMGELVFKENL